MMDEASINGPSAFPEHYPSRIDPAAWVKRDAETPAMDRLCRVIALIAASSCTAMGQGVREE